MTKTFHILIFIITLGFFLTPNVSFACGTTSEKSCCKKETSSKTENKYCCKKDNHTKNKKSDGCDGKCNHAACNCLPLNFNTTLPIITELKHKSFNYSTDKQKFYDVKTDISSGFYSLWLLPKIS